LPSRKESTADRHLPRLTAPEAGVPFENDDAPELADSNKLPSPKDVFDKMRRKK